MLANLPVLALLLAIVTQQVLATPVEDYTLSAPAHLAGPLPLDELEAELAALETNGTLAKREGNKCHGVTVCMKPKFMGKCTAWCYPPDEFIKLAEEWRLGTQSVRMRQTAECWFYRGTTCKSTLAMVPKQFIVWPGDDIYPPLTGNVGCFYCPSADADWFH